MMLISHTVIGTAAASLITGNPVMSFAFAIGSHYLSDMIPHWEYKLRNRAFNIRLQEKISWRDREVWFDILRLGIDFGLGILISVLIFKLYLGIAWSTVIAGIIGGVLPDVLLFINSKYHKEPFIVLQKFHHWCHSKINWSEQPLKGLSTQIIVVAIIICLAIFL